MLKEANIKAAFVNRSSKVACFTFALSHKANVILGIKQSAGLRISQGG